MSSIFSSRPCWSTVVNAISGSMLSTEKTVAYVLMTICLVLGIYEAYARGGDFGLLPARSLSMLLRRLSIGYWTNFFSDAFTGFNSARNPDRQQLSARRLDQGLAAQITDTYSNIMATRTYSNQSLGRRRPC